MARYPKVVGKDVPKQRDKLRATGQAMYGSDMRLSEMLHGVLINSPYASP